MKATIYPPLGTPYQLDVIQEGSSGAFCRTGPNDSPASEWFPYESDKGLRCVVHKGDKHES